ncbi:MAG: protoporphyrinogen oxidase [Chloroflexi bacterium]|nr:protoporphyrinogen oxidase [Chloroflexota bacterium]MDL1941566.1 protoporphyrinogen oxidase [Chloroflexi bacterium CFX2]
MHVVVIGGGITGLSAAWELQKRGASFTLLEASHRWGGKIVSNTLDWNGANFLVEGGPDTLVTRKPEAWDLANELGMLDQIADPGSETRGIYVLDNASLHPIPVSPTRFFATPLLTLRGKLRLLAEPFQPARRDDDDESLADFVRRRLGQEALDKFIGPVLGGIYNTDPEKQSILVSSPIMREMERDGGGLFAGALKRALRGGKKSKAPRFITFKNGLQALSDELVRQLAGDLRLNARVESVTREGDQYRVSMAGGSEILADGVILAALANQASALIEDISAEASRRLREMRQQNIGTVSLVYRETDIPGKPVINGLMIPRREKRMIDAVTYTSRKMPERSPAGYTVLRVFIGGGAPEVVEYSDERLIETVKKELAELLGIAAAPQTWTVFRWEGGFPQAEAGHLKRVDEIEKLLPPGIALAGSSYRGIAVPDCIRQGREAAAKIVTALRCEAISKD